ncbi:MAG: hypothetical protein L6R41_005927 [Letrouitia leprolyta]|nr:MAG: hypothetical protein L6R41_005927 [Letrouitia leprolyta]
MDDTGATMPLSGFSEDRTNRPPHFHVSESIARNERNSRIWAEIFSSNQKQDESVAQYGDRIIVLVDQLTDISLELRGLMHADSSTNIPCDAQRRGHLSSSRGILFENSTQQHGATDDYGYVDQNVAEQSEEYEYDDDRKEEPLPMLGRYPVDRPLEGTQGVKRRADSHQFDAASNPEYGKPSSMVSGQEKDRRKAEGCCYQWGRAGHMQGQCPNKQTRQGEQYRGGSSKKQKRWPAPASKGRD